MTTPLQPAMAVAAADARAWPFEEARRIIKRLDGLKAGADKTVTSGDLQPRLANDVEGKFGLGARVLGRHGHRHRIMPGADR